MIYNNRNIGNQVRQRGRNKRTRLVLDQFAWLLMNDKSAVVDAFQDAGFNVDDDASPQKLKNIVRKATIRIKDKRGKSPKARKLIRNLSVLILTYEKEKDQFANFFKRDKYKTKGTATADSDAKTDSDATDKEKGQFLKENADTIGQIGASLLSGLFSGRGNAQVDEQLNSGAGSMPPPPPKKSNTGLIIGIGVLALAGIGTAIYFMRKKK